MTCTHDYLTRTYRRGQIVWECERTGCDFILNERAKQPWPMLLYGLLIVAGIVFGLRKYLP